MTTTTARAAILSLVLGAALLASPAAGLGVDTATAAQTADGEPPRIDVRYEISRLPERQGVVRVTAVVSVPKPVGKLSVRLPENATHVSYTGFEIAPHGLLWDGVSRTATVTYRAPVGLSTPFGQRTADTEEWTVVTRTEVGLRARWQWRGDRDPTWDERLVVPGRGVGTPTIAYLGPYKIQTRETETATIRLVVPAAATLTDAPETILDSIAGAQRETTVGPRHDVVTVFAVPTWLGPGGYTPTNGEPAATVNAREPVASPANVWVHEFRHMHQPYRTADEMRWLTEGSADYYAATITLRQGHITYDQYRDRVSTDRYHAATLTQPATWESPKAPYHKGARVVAALDVRIQRATGWQRSFEDVLTVLGTLDRPITLAAFIDAVSTVAEEDLDAFVYRALTGPAPTVPDEPHAVTRSGTDDPDGDGLDNAGEWLYGTHPFRADTDGDGVSDGAELDAGSDPLFDEPWVGEEGDSSRHIRPRRTPARYENSTVHQGVAVDTKQSREYVIASPSRASERRQTPPNGLSPQGSLWVTASVLVLTLGLWWRLRDNQRE